MRFICCLRTAILKNDKFIFDQIHYIYKDSTGNVYISKSTRKYCTNLSQLNCIFQHVQTFLISNLPQFLHTGEASLCCFVGYFYTLWKRASLTSLADWQIPNRVIYEQLNPFETEKTRDTQSFWGWNIDGSEAD